MIGLLAAALLLAAAPPPASVELPIGTQFSVRLTTGVSTKASRPGDAVSAILIAPVEVAGQTLLPAGWTLRGTVSEVGRYAERARLRLDFSELVDTDDESRPIATRLVSVDNSRESVEDDGSIVGPPRKRRLPSRAVAAAMVAAYDYPIALAAFEAGRLMLRHAQHTDIDFPAGVELSLGLAQALELPPLSPPGAPLAVDASLADLARAVPYHTDARPHRDGDVTNLLFVGERPQLEHAFLEAGWTQAEPVCLRAQLKGLLSLMLKRSDPSAPVSRLELAGRPPDLVFEKQTDTLAKRHHIRLWREGDLAGQPVWVGAATHDVGITHFRHRYALTHRIDPCIDAEREKVVNDVRLTREFAATALVDRPHPAQPATDASGRPIVTDGLIALVDLRPAPAPPQPE